MNDIKVIDTLREMQREESQKDPVYHALAFFAESIAIARNDVPIEDIAKCFKAQFDEAELKALIKELQ